MNIVAIDSWLLSFEGLQWRRLEHLGTFRHFERTPVVEVAQRTGDAEIVLVGKTPITRPVLDMMPKVRYLGVFATGYDNVDVAEASRRGIAVTNVPAYSTESVVQHTIALLLLLATQAERYIAGVRRGGWRDSGTFAWRPFPLFEVQRRTLGILGFGTIGARVAEVARSLGMEVIIGTLPGRPQRPDRLPLRDLVANSDVVSLHCPVSPATLGMVNDEFLSWFRAGSYLINTSRGRLVDEGAVIRALDSGRLAGAAFDVLPEEPPRESRLTAHPSVITTPHVAWATHEARSRLLHETEENLLAFLRGEPRNRVDQQHGR